MKVSSSKQVLLDGRDEMHLLPTTSKYYKRTYRHYFKRRMGLSERPLIIVTFQGVLGDFIKDGGLSMNQDHLMSKQYQKDFKTYQTNENINYHMWVRIGALDGMKYLAKHF